MKIGNDSTIRDYCLLDAMDGGVISLGQRVQFGAQVALHALELVEMGDDSAAGERVSIFDSDHRHDGGDMTNYAQPVAIAPVIIRTNTFLGANSLLLRGVRMGPERDARRLLARARRRVPERLSLRGLARARDPPAGTRPRRPAGPAAAMTRCAPRRRSGRMSPWRSRIALSAGRPCGG